MRTQGGDSRLRAEERGPGRNQPWPRLTGSLQTCEINFGYLSLQSVLPRPRIPANRSVSNKKEVISRISILFYF